MQIRKLRKGEELALYAVYHSAVHEVACRDYSPEQLTAWAPETIDESRWIERIQRIQPFVVEIGGELAAYADLQPSGYIDHFYVGSKWARRGIGTALMNHLLQCACEQGIASLASNVSLTAESFFRKFGFSVDERQTVFVNGVALENARMNKSLSPEEQMEGASDCC